VFLPYFAIFDYDNKVYLEDIGYNKRTVEDVKSDILELLILKITDKKRFQSMTVEEICLEKEWVLEESETPFGEEEDGEVEFNTVYVDVPNSDPDSEEWKSVETFKSFGEALAFAKEKYNTDDEGRVCLISGATPPKKKTGKISLQTIKSADGWGEVGTALGFDEDKIRNVFEYGEFADLEIIIDENLNIVGGRVIPFKNNWHSKEGSHGIPPNKKI